MTKDFDLDRKFVSLKANATVTDGAGIEGYACVFGTVDHGGDIVEFGAFAKSLAALEQDGRRVKMLWQHDPSQPIGVWDVAREDTGGLYVKGRILTDVERGREAAAMIAAGAIDGLSIGYRTVRARKDDNGVRHLDEVEIWEVSLVTFPMQPAARAASVKKAIHAAESLKDVEAILRDEGRFSRADATALVASIKTLTHGERAANDKASEDQGRELLDAILTFKV